jgi:hypothetical protein|tara:strand:+ start:134 stop:388 length:255 start_codon:yes stop_codon:yes gene_type:complete
MNNRSISKALELLGAITGFTKSDSDEFESVSKHRIEFNQEMDDGIKELLVCLSKKEITIREFQEESKLLLYKHIPEEDLLMESS